MIKSLERCTSVEQINKYLEQNKENLSSKVSIWGTRYIEILHVNQKTIESEYIKTKDLIRKITETAEKNGFDNTTQLGKDLLIKVQSIEAGVNSELKTKNIVTRCFEFLRSLSPRNFFGVGLRKRDERFRRLSQLLTKSECNFPTQTYGEMRSFSRWEESKIDSNYYANLTSYIKNLDFNTHLTDLHHLIQNAKVELSFLGNRLITAQGYEGSVSLNLVAQKLIRTAYQRSEADDLVLEERYAGVEISRKLEKFYKITSIKIENANRILRLIDWFRDFYIFSCTRIYEINDAQTEKIFLHYSKERFENEIGGEKLSSGWCRSIDLKNNTSTFRYVLKDYILERKLGLKLSSPYSYEFFNNKNFDSYLNPT